MEYIKSMNVYLTGGMENLSWEKQSMWRNVLKYKLENSSSKVKVNVCSPIDYYNFENKRHISIREPMEYDLYRVRHSDLMIVNFTYKQNSLGTMAEMSIAYDRNIPVIGLAENGIDGLHDWQKSMPIRIFTNMNELIEHVIEFYFN